ncbi:hypothetical protein GCM10023321_33520 [Pseudonocardia eucalypti]|uniref:HTH luxR-type domain-containing protein n=1 Tax=Pseudonocardia eucalypti TaxID=648755 RepID=A0ABP9Q562_9PSEU|nr:DNA-binding CsgD family transcriptional regulator [Pseudonocardia eucalypti]
MAPTSGPAVLERARSIDWVGRGTALPVQRHDEVVAALTTVADVLPGFEAPEPAGVDEYQGAQRAVRTAWDRVFAALSVALHGEAGAIGQPPVCPTRHLDLLNELKRLDQELYADRLRLRDAALGRVTEALSQLREPTSTDELLGQALAAMAVLGFDRAIQSRVEETTWITDRTWIERDPKWADDVLEVGRANPRVLDRSLVETEMLRRKAGIVVQDVQERPAVNRAIAEASLSNSYVAVPLLAQGEVVGFLHADCYYQGREMDEFDRLLLTIFAEGVGQALGRTVMMDRLTSIRTGFDQVAGVLAAATQQRVELGVRAPRRVTAMPGAFAPLRHPGFDDLPTGSGEGSATLTRREVEVLRLMAAGDTNGRIARRLVISEGTVKSHVKHILRKLGAANRAEAVSRWLGMEHQRNGAVGPGREA